MELLNILVRTSARPVQFRRCLSSIATQTYEHIRLLVSYDTTHKPDYIPDFWRVVEGEPDTVYPVYTIPVHPTYLPFGYNLYCNDLKEQVSDGYFIVVDDDGTLINKTIISQLMPLLHPDKANIVRFTRGNRVKPARNEIVSGKIGMPCIVLHSKHKHIANFGPEENADYLFIKACADKLGVNYIPLTVVRDDKRQRGAMEVNLK